MNILGVGGPELMAILIIMLVFAGPKRMIHWSYILGQYVAKFRVMWSQTVDVVQQEFDAAGLDVKLPKEPPTRKNFNKAISDAIQPMTQPLQDTMNEVKKDVDGMKEVSDDLKKATAPVKMNFLSQEANKKPVEKIKSPTQDTKPPAKEAQPSLGTWGGDSQSASTDMPSSNGKQMDMGTWSSSTDKSS